MEKYFKTLDSKFNESKAPMFNHGVKMSKQELENLYTLTNALNKDIAKNSNTITAEKKHLIDTQKSKILQLSKICAEAKLPMQESMGILKLMKTTYLSDEQLKYINIMQTLLDNIDIKLDQVADYTKVEMGEFIPSLKPFNLNGLVYDVYDYYKIKALRSDVKLNLVMQDSKGNEDNFNYNYKSDTVRLEQILNTMLSNAIEFTDHGKIDFIVERVGHYGNLSEYKFIIRDTGTGVKLDKMSKLFQQVKLKYSNSILNSEKEMQKSDFNIISKIAKYMGGELTIESSGYQSGIQFVLTLPLENN